MLANNGRLKIAVQKSGRLTDDVRTLLGLCGLDLEFQSKSLHVPCRNFDLDVLNLRDDDIPEYVQDGIADLGIVGANVVAESGVRVERLLDLGFGRCRLMICVPSRFETGTIHDLDGCRIATSYPRTLARYLHRHGVCCQIVELNGSVELAPTLNVADAICDIVSTGSTARVNGLVPLWTVLESQAVLIAAVGVLEDPARKALIDRLLIRIRASLQARGKRYLMLNAPAAAVPRLKEIIPGMKSPTVVPLAEEGMVALHSVIPEEVFWEVMENLKRSGASDIVVVPIETIIQ
jgi:ATP phosphoribosyltransferase